MHVVIWEPRSGHGGGHQLTVGGYHRAEYLQRRLSKLMPYCSIRIETAEAYAAAAVLERGEQRQRRERQRPRA